MYVGILFNPPKLEELRGKNSGFNAVGTETPKKHHHNGESTNPYPEIAGVPYSGLITMGFP